MGGSLGLAQGEICKAKDEINVPIALSAFRDKINLLQTVGAFIGSRLSQN